MRTAFSGLGRVLSANVAGWNGPTFLGGLVMGLLTCILQASLFAARQQMERSIAIDEKHFDPDHPALATRYNNLAWIELDDDNTAGACELWRRTLEILLKHFDDDHPHVKTVRETLALHCGE